MIEERKEMDNFLSVAYAASLAVSQALLTFTDIRAQQKAIENMDSKDVQKLLQNNAALKKKPMGFTQAEQGSG